LCRLDVETKAFPDHFLKQKPLQTTSSEKFNSYGNNQIFKISLIVALLLKKFKCVEKSV